MKLVANANFLFYGACVLGFLVPFLRGGSSRWQASQMETPSIGKQPWSRFLPLLLMGLVPILLFAVAAMSLNLEAASGLPYLLGGLIGFVLLAGLGLASGLRGILLLVGAFIISGTALTPEAAQLPLLSYLFGLSLAKVLVPADGWEDFALPAAWAVGSYWLSMSATESTLQPLHTMLAICLAVAMLLRALQTIPLLAEKNEWLRAAFITITGGLAAWLGIQTMLIQPSLLNWVWLFTGGILLSFVLVERVDEDQSRPLLHGAIHLVLIGIAALVASRLFGTLGWVILAVGLLARLKVTHTVAIAGLFFLVRAPLQGFIYQYNPNVTGINITHPYASAALYVGFAAMLLLPGLLNTLSGHFGPVAKADEPLEGRLSWGHFVAPALLLTGSVLAGGLSNYFLHAEATSSLLVALTVAGVGISLLGRYHEVAHSVLPLLFTSVVLQGALLSPELLELGNQADKSQKLIVLSGVLILTLLSFLTVQWMNSRRKPVQVS